MNKIELNGNTYVLESDVQEKEVLVNLVQGESVASNYVGKKVICRTRNEGLNAGVVVALDSTGVILKNVRRIWYHKPADSSTSWYEGVAKTGLHKDSKVSCTVKEKVIMENYSLTLCNDNAFSSIMEKEPHGSI